MPSVLITGSNRGIGLEWARQYAREGWRVYATCRYPAEAAELSSLEREFDHLTLHRLDVTDNQSIVGVHAELRDAPIDVLLNNAGVYLEKGAPALGALRYDDWLTTFDVNSLGAVRVTEAFAANVAASKRRLVVATTSHMGTIADINFPGSYYYRSSKAALNAAFKGLAEELRPQKVGVLIVHPGAVKTRMGGGESRISTERSVTAMRRLVEEFRLEQSGRFLQWDGSELPW